ncbi:hypothetical protein [Arachidicoccus ginsenosidivorans]|uniref:hypothetical protein n=1 Tax=Arachidicoccus ginsenosidivorans TaxID=496057 RepID=UPI0013153A69|nr:hypothetical protein [Arachidicoccus ginsenosidivorans]
MEGNLRQDTMYEKYYAFKQLKTPNRYFNFQKENWFFITQDGNNEKILLDEEK